MGVEDNDLFYHYSADTMSVTCRMTTDIVIPDDVKKSDKVFTNPEREYTKCGYLETERFLYFVSTNYGANLVMSLVDKKDWTSYRMYVYTSEFKYKMENVESFPYLKMFLDKAKDAKVEYDEEQYEECLNIFKTQLKATVARLIWGMNAYYQVIQELDETIQRAVKLMETGQ